MVIPLKERMVDRFGGSIMRSRSLPESGDGQRREVPLHAFGICGSWTTHLESAIEPKGPCKSGSVESLCQVRSAERMDEDTIDRQVKGGDHQFSRRGEALSRRG